MASCGTRYEAVQVWRFLANVLGSLLKARLYKTLAGFEEEWKRSLRGPLNVSEGAACFYYTHFLAYCKADRVSAISAAQRV